MTQALVETTWTNASNAAFYNDLDLNYYARAAGLDTCMDVTTAQKHLGPKDGPVLEVGAGMGRVVTALFERGYTSVSAIERADTAQDLARQFEPQIKKGQFHLYNHSLKTFQCEERFNTILWLFCGITDFSPMEQADMLAKLSRLLNPGGHLIVDLPMGESNATKVEGQEHVIKREDKPDYHGYVPTDKEMEIYRRATTCACMEKLPYTTDTGRDRALFVFSGPNHF